MHVCVPVRCHAFAALLTAVMLGTALLAAPVYASPSTPSEQYLALRRIYPPVPGLTPRLLADRPDTYKGVVLEIVGRLTGVVRHDDGIVLMLATDSGPSLTLYMSEQPTWLQPGERLRVLAVAVEPEQDTEGQTVVVGVPDMKVVAVASASDITAAESRWQQSAASRTARDKQTQAALRAAAATLNAPASRSGRIPSRSSATLASRGGAIRGSGALFGYLSPSAREAYPRYLGFIQSHNRRLTDKQADAITTSLLLFSERYQVDPRLMVALIIAESDFNPSETSNKGAMGLGQLMPDEVKTLGLTNPYDPTQNIAGAVYLLRGRLDKYSGGGDLTMQHIILALASYNAGMGAVKKYGGVPPYRETQNYVKKIERLYRQLCGMSATG